MQTIHIPNWCFVFVVRIVFEPATTCITFYLRDLVCPTVPYGLVGLKNYPSIKSTKCYSEFWWFARSRNICWPINNSNYHDRFLVSWSKIKIIANCKSNWISSYCLEAFFKQNIQFSSYFVTTCFFLSCILWLLFGIAVKNHTYVYLQKLES